MQFSPKTPEVVRFGIFEVDRRAGELRKGGVKIRLQEQPLQILLMLLQRPGDVVTREEIQARLWPSGTIVEFEHSIGTAIKKLRQALGDEADAPRYIETLPRRGFRFIAPVDRPASQPPPSREPDAHLAGSRRWWPWVAALLLFFVGGLAAVFILLKPEPGSGPPRVLTRLTFDAGLQFGPTWSPDGRFIAYSSDRGGKFDIWVQQVGAISPVKITTRPGHNWQPDWSPDGNQVVFRSEGEGGGLFVVPALGGAERRITSFGYRPRWSPDGRRIVFGNTFVPWLNKLYLVGLDGDPPREVLTEFLKRSHIAERCVDWRPHSDRISVWGETAQRWGFWTVSLDGTGAVESRATDKVAEQLSKLTRLERAQFRWGPSGRAIYFEGEWNGVRNVWKITVDPSTMRFVALDRVTTGPGPDAEVAISADGKSLAYAARHEQVRVWSYPFDAKSGRLLGDGKAVTPAGFDAWQSDISPDGKKLAYIVKRAEEYELWQAALPDGPATLLVRSGDLASSPRWSPDSRRLGYSPENLSNTSQIVILPEGGGTADPVTSPLFEGDLEDWSPDGQWIVANQATHEQPGPTQMSILLLPLSAAPKAEAKARLVTTSHSAGSYEGIFQIRQSPNGRWIVFEAVRGGIAPGGASNATLCVVPVSGGPWIRITDGQSWDDKPRWSPDGKTIYYISSRTGFLNVWGIRFDPDEGRPHSQPFQVTSFESPNLMVADDTDWLSMSVSQDRLVTSMKETFGSIWALHDVER